MQGLPVREWRRGDFLLSTDTSLIDLEAVGTAFDSDTMPWAVKLPDDLLRIAINSSLCLGIYHSPEEPGSGKPPDHDHLHTSSPANTASPQESPPGA